jgi:hypothetical protein
LVDPSHAASLDLPEQAPLAGDVAPWRPGLVLSRDHEATHWRLVRARLACGVGLGYDYGTETQHKRARPLPDIPEELPKVDGENEVVGPKSLKFLASPRGLEPLFPP